MGPKNQMDFLKVLYVVVMEWAGSFGILWKHLEEVTLNTEVIPMGSQESRPILVHFSGPSKDEI